ncbi:MAG: hypothetical protein ABSG31_18195 [Tepidisphaeraceae bacterium]|jgi:hypothetical protein
MGLDTSGTQITLFGYTCWDEGVKEKFCYDGPSSATRTIVCMWSDRIGLLNAIRGNVTEISPTVVQITPPITYPAAPWLYLNSCDVDGIPAGGLTEDANGVVAYKYARIKIFFQSLWIQSGVLAIDFGTELYSPPHNQSVFTWNDELSPSGPVPASLSPHITINRATLRIPVTGQFSIPRNQIIAAKDSVNTNTFWDFPPGTVHFEGANSVRRMLANGQLAYDITYNFTWRSVGWNVGYDPANGWRPIKYTASGEPPYPNYDFAQLGIPITDGQ